MSSLILLSILLASAIYYFAVLSVVMIFKPRIQGTTFGVALSMAYVFALFEPLITATTNPPWISYALIIIFSIFAALVAISVKYEKKDPLPSEEFDDFEPYVKNIKEEYVDSDDEISSESDGTQSHHISYRNSRMSAMSRSSFKAGILRK